MRFAAWLAGFGLIVGLSGCGGEPTGPPIFPVDGRVEYRGKAANGAFVVFHPLRESSESAEPIRPTGKVDEGGRFRLTSLVEHDGAPAGEYAVTVEWYKLVNQGADWQRGPNVIPSRYAGPGTTPLRVTIREGANSIDPFQIVR